MGVELTELQGLVVEFIIPALRIAEKIKVLIPKLHLFAHFFAFVLLILLVQLVFEL